MTCNAPIFVGDVGTIFRLTFKECVGDVPTIVDISTSTSKSFVFRRPDNSLLTVTPVFTTDGTDGKLQYTSVTDDINMIGVWCLQGSVTFSGSGPYHGTVVKFDVDAALDVA